MPWSVNHEDRNGRPSRYAKWMEGVSLPAPPIRRLAHLPLLEPPVQRRVNLTHWGFSYGDDIYYEPKVEGRSDRARLYMLWMDAAGSHEPIQLYTIKLTIGWRMEICLRGEWLEAVPKGQQELTQEEHASAKEAAMRALKDKRARDLDADTEAALALFGALPKRLNTTVEGKYILPNSTQQYAGNARTSENVDATEMVLSDQAQSAPKVSSTSQPKASSKGAQRGNSKKRTGSRGRARGNRVRDRVRQDAEASDSEATEEETLPSLKEALEKLKSQKQ